MEAKNVRGEWREQGDRQRVTEMVQNKGEGIGGA